MKFNFKNLFKISRKDSEKSNIIHPRFDKTGLAFSTPVINKVVSVTPAGRERNLEILVPYLLKNRHVINNHIFWINTNIEEDVDYIKNICRKYPDFFSFIESKVKVNGNQSILHFYKYCQDVDTIYIKIDDDICFIENEAIENLVNFRIKNPEYFLVMGNIINNSICSFIHQKIGNIPNFYPPIQYSSDDTMGWKNPIVAKILHNNFLNDIVKCQISKYFFKQWILNDFNRFSINFFCWFGKDFHDFEGKIGKTDFEFINDDEEWLTVFKTKKDNRPNVICGNSLVSHFAFFTQRDFLESQTNLLDSYKDISLNL